MTGAGESGYANILQFPAYDMANPLGRNVNPNMAGGKQYMNNVNELIGPEGPVQLDGSAIDRIHYESMAGLRNYALDLLLNQGIDVSAAPNLDDPASIEANELWNAALTKHREDAAKRAQTKENLDYLMKAANEKDVLYNRQLLDEKYNSGFVSNRDVMENSFASDNPIIANVNEKLMATPETAEEAQDQMRNYWDAVAGIDDQVLQGYMSFEQGEYYKSQLYKPSGQFDNRMTEAKLKTEDARRRSLNRANRSKSSSKKDKKSKGSIADQFPKLTDLARFLGNPDLKHSTTEYQSTSTYTDSSGSPLTSFQSPFWVGATLGGSKDYKFEKFNELEDGNYEAIFTKRKMGKDPEGNDVVKGTDAEYVRFSKDNLLPVLEATLSDSQWRQVKKDLVEAGAIKGGRLSVQDLMEAGAGVNDDLPGAKPKKTSLGFGKPAAKVKLGF